MYNINITSALAYFKSAVDFLSLISSKTYSYWAKALAYSSYTNPSLKAGVTESLL